MSMVSLFAQVKNVLVLIPLLNVAQLNQRQRWFVLLLLGATVTRQGEKCVICITVQPEKKKQPSNAAGIALKTEVNNAIL